MKQCKIMKQISEVAKEVIAGRSEAPKEVANEVIVALSEALEKARGQTSVGIGLVSAVSDQMKDVIGRVDLEEEENENTKHSLKKKVLLIFRPTR